MSSCLCCKHRRLHHHLHSGHLLHAWTPRCTFLNPVHSTKSTGRMADLNSPTDYEPKQITELTAIDPSQLPLWIWRSTLSNQRICWLHHCFHRSEKQVQTYQVYHSHRENLMTDSSRLQSSTTRPVAFGHSESERDITRILEEQRQQPLSEAHTEILKQECRAEKAEADTRELQQQIHSS